MSVSVVGKVHAQDLREAAFAAAQAAGNALMRRFRTQLQIREKADAGLVTEADLAAERAAMRVLKSRFPKFGILTEESAGQDAKCPGRFILDPLDGTTNYAHGLTTFCVSIAAEWEGQVVAGVVYQPALGDFYSAIRGRGAFVNGRRMRVSKTAKLADALLSTGFSSRKDLWLDREIEIFTRLSRKANAVRRPGSAALDLALIARGAFDGFWEGGLAPWDVAAGSLLVEEAGGKVTDFGGKPISLDGREIIASNGRIHAELLRGSGLRPGERSLRNAKAARGSARSGAIASNKRTTHAAQ